MTTSLSSGVGGTPSRSSRRSERRLRTRRSSRWLARWVEQGVLHPQPLSLRQHEPHDDHGDVLPGPVALGEVLQPLGGHHGVGDVADLPDGLLVGDDLPEALVGHDEEAVRVAQGAAAGVGLRDDVRKEVAAAQQSRVERHPVDTAVLHTPGSGGWRGEFGWLKLQAYYGRLQETWFVFS